MLNLLSRPVLPTHIEDCIILEGYSSALMLENILGPALIDPEPGLYKPNDITPCVRLNGTFFSFDPRKISISEQYKPIFSIDDIEGVVVDADTRTVLTNAVTARKNEILSTRPSLPAVGLQLVKTLVDYDVNSRLMFNRSLEWHTRRFAENFKDDPSIYGITVEAVLDYLSFINTNINQFVGNNIWNYYFVSIRGTDILIEKGADYRICEWYEMKQRENDNADLYSTRIHRGMGSDCHF